VIARMLRTRLEIEQTRNIQQLESDLRQLAQGIATAREAIKRGDFLDEHLIVNASGISARIARYNLTRDSLPYLKESGE
jgi:hypothetical protein